MIFNGIIKRIAAKKAGEFSKRIMLLKGTEPAVVMGTLSGAAVAACKILGVEIDEPTIKAIIAGALATYSAYKMVGNRIKQIDNKK
jgi:hypothetical protein